MLAQFQARYPTGSLISELLTIYQGKFVVRVLAQVEGVTRATGMAAAETLELAEDRARSRAIEVMAIDPTQLQATTPTQLSDTQVLEQPLTGKIAPHFLQTQPSSSFDSTDELSAPAYSDNTPASPIKESTPVTVGAAGIKAKREPAGKDKSNSFNLNSTFSEPQQPFEDFGTTSEIQTESSDNPASSDNLTPFVPSSYISQTNVEASEQVDIATNIDRGEPTDLSDVIAQTTVQLKRIGWNNKDGRDYLLQTYNKPRRDLLTDEELLEFLHFLESQPSKSK